MLCVGCIANDEHKWPNVRKLVNESSSKKAVLESNLLMENPLTPADASAAVRYMASHPDYTSYHLLIAVKRYFPAIYGELHDDIKAKILCSALTNTKYLNDWGYLHPSGSYDGESAKALLAIGKANLKSLIPVLDDDSEARLVGSESSTISIKYHFRRKDFAYRYALLTLGGSPIFRTDLKDRDHDIEALKRKLGKLQEAEKDVKGVLGTNGTSTLSGQF